MNILLSKVLSLFHQKNSEEKSLLKGASSSFIIKTVGAGLAFGVNILLARLLGVKNYGAYIYVYSWIAIVMIVIPLGFDKSLLRFIPEYKQAEDWSGLKGILSFSYKSVFTLSLAVVAIVITVAIFVDGTSWAYSKRLILIGTVILPFLGLMLVTLKALRGFKKVATALIPQMIIMQVVTGAVVIGYYAFQENVSAENAMIAKLAAVAVSLSVGLYFLKQVLPKQLKKAKTAKKYKYWLSISLPMLLIAGIHIVLKKTDIIMIGLFLSKGKVGVYGAVVKIAALALFGLQAVNVIAAPLISELYHANKKEKLQNVVTLANRFSFAIALISAIVFIFFGKYVLSFFGSTFATGYTTLLIFLVAYLFNAFSGSTGYIMTMTGHQNVAARVLGLSAVVNIILNYVLVPIWGIEGAAIATGISMILWNLIMIIYIKKKLNINATII